MPLIIISFILLFSANVFALPFNNALSFAPPATDLSLVFLGNIFGVVDGVLAGSGSQLFGKIIGVFNASLLALGSIMIMYTIIVGTIHTAHEGEFMGKKWSSIWVPIRMVSGTALLVPKASGYSLIQIFVMWVVIQGVGAADKVWSAALDYLSVGGKLVQAQADAHADAGEPLEGEQNTLWGGTVMLIGQVCMEALQHQLEVQHELNQTSCDPKTNRTCNIIVPNLSASVNFTQLQQSLAPITPYFNLPLPNLPSDSPYAGVNGFCGQIRWNNLNLDGLSRKIIASPVKFSSSQIQEMNLSRAIALQQMYDATMIIANQMVNNSAVFNPRDNSKNMLNRAVYSQFGTALTDVNTPCTQYDNNCQIWGAEPDLANSSSNATVLFTGGEMHTAVQSYNNVMMPTLNLLQELDNQSEFQEKRDFIKNSKANGWMFAGAYFFDLIKISGDPLANQNLVDSNSGVKNSVPLSLDDANLNKLKPFFSDDALSSFSKNLSYLLYGAQPCSTGNCDMCDKTLSINSAQNFDPYRGFVRTGEGQNKSTFVNSCSTTVLGYLANSFYLAIPGQPGKTAPNFPQLIPNIGPPTLPPGSSSASTPCGSVAFIGCIGRRIAEVGLYLAQAIWSIVYNFLLNMLYYLIDVIIIVPIQIIVFPLLQGAWNVLIHHTNSPVVSLANMGALMIDRAVNGYLAQSLLEMALAPTGVGLALVLPMFLVLVTPFILPWYAYFLSVGFVTAYYVPLLPYMIFTFGTVAWLMAVIESMVAAPIMALGVMTPEGEGVMGRAEHGFMILLNVFLRPSMMVIGFLMGIVLTYVSVWVLNTAFGYAASFLATGENGGLNFTDKPFVLMYAMGFYITMYISLYSTVVQKSFQLISMLPDKVLRWVGGSPESYGESTSEWLSDAKKMTDEQSKGAGESSKGLGEMGSSYKKLKEAGQAAKDKKDAENKGGSVSEGGGGEGGG